MSSKLKYQIQDQGRWVDCTLAAPEMRFGKEWLRYELPDGTVGLSRPDHWRVKP